MKTTILSCTCRVVILPVILSSLMVYNITELNANDQALVKSNTVKIYPYMVNPEDYPNYKRLPSPPPTREDFFGRMIYKNTSPTTSHLTWFSPKKKLEVDTMSQGRVFRVHGGTAVKKDPEMTEWIKHYQDYNKEDKFAFRLSGFKLNRIPDIDRYNFDHMTSVPGGYAGLSSKLYRLFGNKFYGIQMGELMAEYIGICARHSIGFPFPRDKRRNYLRLQEYISNFGNRAGNRIALHGNALAYHYAAKENNLTYLEAQNFYRGECNPKVRYMFIRGACRQYGVLLSGGLSFQTNWGNKWILSQDLLEKQKAKLADFFKGREIPDYMKNLNPWAAIPEQGKKDGVTRDLVFTAADIYYRTAEHGVSLNYARRLIYMLYLYNSVAFNYELGEYEKHHLVRETDQINCKQAEKRKPIKMTPFGKMLINIDKFIQKHPEPGAMITPVALLFEFGDLWRPMDSRQQQFYNWAVKPYTAGDYYTANLFSLLVPAYDSQGQYKNEAFALPDTPFGEMTDCLYTDIRPEILNEYALVLLAGDYQYDFEYKRKLLEDYMKQGGQVVITGNNARKIWPEFDINDKPILLAEKTKITLESKTVIEPNSFYTLQIQKMPMEAKVLAQTNGIPLAFEKKFGKGSLTVLLSRDGINNKPHHFDWELNPNAQNPKERKRPFYLNAFVKKILSDKITAQQLFTAGKELSWIVNRDKNGDYTIGVFNNSMESKKFKINSKIGEIDSVIELKLPDLAIKKALGYWPLGYKDHDPGCTNDNYIEGGDVRLFKVKLKNDCTSLIPKKQLQSTPNRFVAMPSFIQLEERLLTWPAFFNYFRGVKLPGSALLDADNQYIKEKAKRFNRLQTAFIIDARDCKNPVELKQIFKKMMLLTGAENLLLDESIIDEESRIKLKAAGICINNPNINLINQTDDVENKGNIQVLDLEYNNWDDLYMDARTLWLNPDRSVNLRGHNSHATKATSYSKVRKINQNRFLAISHVRDITNNQWINQDFFNNFGGIVVDASYLHATSMTKLVRDKKWLQQTGIKLIVNFTREVKSYNEVTFHPTRNLIYDEGVRYYKDVFAKMKYLGIIDAVVSLHKIAKKDMSDIIQAFKQYCQTAATAGITIYLRPTMVISHNSMTKFIKKLQHEGINNLKLAGSGMHYAKKILNDNSKHKQNVPLIFLAAVLPGITPDAWKDQSLAAVPYPLHQATPKYADNLKKLAEDENSIQVLETEYKTWDEINKDLTFIGWNQ